MIFRSAIMLISKLRRSDYMKQEDMSIWVPVGMSLLGRVIDADGKPCDDGPELFIDQYYPLEVAPPDASS